MRLTRPRLRPIRLLVLFALVILGYISIAAYRHKTRLHVLQPDLYRWHNVGPSHHLLLPDKTGQFCEAHGFEPWLGSGRREQRIYDLVMLSTELDWLEIRLHTLSPYVDYFVVVESKTTFTGLPKPVYLEENWEKFSAFHRKIIHRVVEDPGPAVGNRTWDHEDYLRNAMFNNVFPNITGTDQEAQEGDVLIVGDIDEVPKPETLVVLRKCDIPDRLTLRSHFYYYSFQWLHRGEQWAHPQATVYHGLASTISPKDLRNGEGPHGWFFLGDLRRWWEKADMWNAAWHCSSCFATVKEMQTKMNSFSHVPWNTPENRDQKTIVERVRGGKDLFGRETEVYDRFENNKDVPAYVLQHSEKFRYLLDRDGVDGGFTDVDIEAIDSR
jgi:beta-1,4-mannosyl-glycoprotein beta-1,4-N-acetylglucosaminyltransferase